MRILVGLALVGCTCLGAFLLRKSHLPEDEVGNAAYVWQRDWTSAVCASVLQAAPSMAAFMVLGAEAEVEGQALQWRYARVDWRTLSLAKKPVAVTLRARTLPGLCEGKVEASVTTSLLRVAQTIVGDAKAAGVSVDSVQLDVDCPTRGLPAFAVFLEDLGKRLANTPLAITTLPTWLSSPAFSDVLRRVDYFVLQIHSLRTPATVHDEGALFDAARVSEWVRKAGSFGRPFYVALPTYGYRLFFDSSGDYVKATAEGGATMLAGCTSRDLHADPQAVAREVQRARKHAPPTCLGITWFRLPVEGERLNWSWPVLAQVMQGHCPPPEVRAEVRQPQEGLYEVWVKNEGEYNPSGSVRVHVEWTSGDVVASDAIGGFSQEYSLPTASTVLVGMPPGPHQETMAAWLRIRREDTSVMPVFRIAAVETKP